MKSSDKTPYLRFLRMGSRLMNDAWGNPPLPFLFIFSISFACLASDIFVAPEGRGAITGADWSNALNGSRNGYHIDVKNAITNAVANGATEVNVYFAAGDYSITNQLSLSSITVPVKLSGGYIAETDGSLEKSETVTTLARNTSYYTRFIYANAMSDFHIEGITFSGGYFKSGTYGGAIYLDSAATVITNCVFTGNKLAQSNSYQSHRGGAIYVTGGSLSLQACQFNSNSMSSNYAVEWGGAVCTVNTDFVADGCAFSGNSAAALNQGGIGGAVCINGKRATIRNSTFENNSARSTSNTGTGYPSGGALAVRSATRFEMSDCRLSGNYALVYNATRTDAHISGCLFDDFNASDGVMTAVVTRCVFDSRSVSTTAKYNKSDILLDCGRLFMTNCVILGARGAHADMTHSVRVRRIACNSGMKDLVSDKYALVVTPCSLELVNCTIADGQEFGVEAIGSDTGLTLKNCISYGHSVSGVVNATSIEYSCVQEEHEGEGNFVADPHWTGAPYYHLLTKRADGAITNGWFGGKFESERTLADSPCIDAGAPDSVGLSLEPPPHGRRVNLGAYGGTQWASMKSDSPQLYLMLK